MAVNSCPRIESLLLIATKAGVDPRRVALGVRFSGYLCTDWSDALATAQALARDVNGVAFAFYRDGYNDYARAVQLPR